MSVDARIALKDLNDNVTHVVHPRTDVSLIDGIEDAAIQAINDIDAGIFIPALDTYYYRPSLMTPYKTGVTIPAGTAYMISGTFYEVTENTNVDITIAAATRAGKDLYLYAVETNDGTPSFLISANSTYPDGYTAVNTRKLGGFHCLCNSVGTIAGHELSGYSTGDIIPGSVWDLRHKPAATHPEGMTFVPGLGLWADIYLASASGTELVSVYRGTIADESSSPAFHWYKFSQWFSRVGKRMATQQEFMELARGSNYHTTINGASDPGTTGGHVDSASRRMISHHGCEDCCGAMWQWGVEPGGGYGASSWTNAYDSNDSGDMRGQSYNAPNHAILGGNYQAAISAYTWAPGQGLRCSYWVVAPLAPGSTYGSRGVCESVDY